MLKVDQVTKTFGGLVAVDNVELAVDRGEIVGLIGPNGAGKTTLFNTITGVHSPDPGGSIVFDGTDILGRKSHDIARLGLARTFQIVRVFSEMTVLENAVTGALFGTGESVSRAAAEEVAYDALAFVGLDEKADQQAASLPIAQQKQLELARALAAGPKLVLLDEIASGLTPKEIQRLSDTIGRIRDDRDVSVFWIEHIMDAIMGTVDRIVVLNSGQVIAEGPPDEIKRNQQVIEAYLGDEA